jgi:hypothetical protein
LDDPLTPDDQRALAHYVRQHLTDRSPEGTLQLLQALNDLSEAALDDALDETATTATADTELLPAAFALDIVQACCPMPEPKSALYVEIAQAASKLHNVITRPERVYVGNQYYRLQWVPTLGPALSSLVVNLRARCYWNVRTGELRDTCHASWSELAAEIGCTARQLRNLRHNPDLAQFIELLVEGHGRARSQFRVRMSDPLIVTDQQQFERQVRQEETLRVDPETGQIDAGELLTQKTPAPEAQYAEDLALRNDAQAEDSAPGSSPQTETLTSSASPNGEILAPGDRKFWHIDGVQGEVLAHKPGNSGTDLKLHLMTPNQKGLTETTLTITPALLADERRLAAAALNVLLTHMGIQQPNHGKLVARHPRCDWVVAWSLYVLTQPGLSTNKPGYLYNRLWAQDPPPPGFLHLATLPLDTWRRFVYAERRRDPHQIPAALETDYATWRTLLGPVLHDLHLDLPAIEMQCEGERQPQILSGTERFPASFRNLLDEDDQIEKTETGWEIATWDLYRAYRLARLAQQERGPAIVVFYCDDQDVEHVLNAEVLALTVEPLAGSVWKEAQLELAWVMSRGVFEQRWRGVRPLGILRDDAPCVVLGVPTVAACDWIVSRQTALVERTLSEILGHSLQVRFMVYGQEQPVAQPSRW